MFLLKRRSTKHKRATSWGSILDKKQSISPPVPQVPATTTPQCIPELGLRSVDSAGVGPQRRHSVEDRRPEDLPPRSASRHTFAAKPRAPETPRPTKESLATPPPVDRRLTSPPPRKSHLSTPKLPVERCYSPVPTYSPSVSYNTPPRFSTPQPDLARSASSGSTVPSLSSSVGSDSDEDIPAFKTLLLLNSNATRPGRKPVPHAYPFLSDNNTPSEAGVRRRSTVAGAPPVPPRRHGWREELLRIVRGFDGLATPAETRDVSRKVGNPALGEREALNVVRMFVDEIHARVRL